MKQTKKLLLILILLVFCTVIYGCNTPPTTPTVQDELYLTCETEVITIYPKEQFQIELNTNIDDFITFESLDEKYATVDENGLVTGKSVGEAKIYIFYNHLELFITVKVVQKTYKLTIDGYDTIETIYEGQPINSLLIKEYGERKHPVFEDYDFEGFYIDKEFTKELDLSTKLEDNMTIYPKLTLDTTKCDYKFSIYDTLFKDSKLKINENIMVITPDFGATVKYNDETYENCLLVEVRFNYNSRTHTVTNTYLDGNKQNVKIPYDGFIIIVPKNNENFDTILSKLNIGAKISLDRYSINVASRIYVNETHENIDSSITVSLTAQFSTAYDYTNDVVLFEKNAHQKAYPASTTKIITGLAALQYAPLDLKITVGDELDVMRQGSSPSTAGLKKGQVWTLRQLLYAMLLPSGNDASYTIAAGVARSLPGNENKSTDELLQIFNNLMNDVRDQVGATNSNFMVPDGNSYYNSDGSWSDRISNHYVTASDMIKFAILAFNYPGLAKVTSTPYINFHLENGENYVFSNTNSLLKSSSDYYYEYAVGLKTGTTNPAGSCLVFGAEVDGRFVIGAVMKSSNRYTDALAILRSTFKK